VKSSLKVKKGGKKISAVIAPTSKTQLTPPGFKRFIGGSGEGDRSVECTKRTKLVPGTSEAVPWGGLGGVVTFKKK